jgi:predicted lipid-binding transport protein (Tim44 family)
MVDQVVHRFKLRETIARILDLLMRPDRATQAVVVASNAATAGPLPDAGRQELAPRDAPPPAERRAEAAPAAATEGGPPPAEAEHAEQHRP